MGREPLFAASKRGSLPHIFLPLAVVWTPGGMFFIQERPRAGCFLYRKGPVRAFFLFLP